MSTLIELVSTLYRYNEWANARSVTARAGSGPSSSPRRATPVTARCGRRWSTS